MPAWIFWAGLAGLYVGGFLRVGVPEITAMAIYIATTTRFREAVAALRGSPRDYRFLPPRADRVRADALDAAWRAAWAEHATAMRCFCQGTDQLPFQARIRRTLAAYEAYYTESAGYAAVLWLCGQQLGWMLGYRHVGMPPFDEKMHDWVHDRWVDEGIRRTEQELPGTHWAPELTGELVRRFVRERSPAWLRGPV